MAEDVEFAEDANGKRFVEALNLKGGLKPGALPPKTDPAEIPEHLAPLLAIPRKGAGEPGSKSEAVVHQRLPSDWPGVEELRKTGYFVRNIHTHSVKDDKGREIAAFATVLLSRP